MTDSTDEFGDYLVLDDAVPPTRCCRGDVQAGLQIAYDRAMKSRDKLTLDAVRAEIRRTVDALVIFKRRPSATRRIDEALEAAGNLQRHGFGKLARRSLRKFVSRDSLAALHASEGHANCQVCGGTDFGPMPKEIAAEHNRIAARFATVGYRADELNDLQTDAAQWQRNARILMTLQDRSMFIPGGAGYAPQGDIAYLPPVPLIPATASGGAARRSGSY
jgi:hypothetical protein